VTPVVFRRVSVEQGLSQSIVSSIFQNRAGFLYVATEDGLNRFDGFRFTLYRASPTSTNTLSYNELRAISEDTSGVLWLGTFGGGINSLDPATGVFGRYRHDVRNPDSLAVDLVRTVHVDGKGTVWVGMQGGGLDRFDPASGRFTHFRHDPATPASLASDNVRVLLEDRAGTLWVGTEDAGLDRLDPVTGRFAHYRHRVGDDASLGHDTVTSLAEGRDGTLWVGTNGSGLCALDRATGRFECLRARPGKPDAFPSDLVSACLEDHEGNLWIGTDGAGLARRDRLTGAVTTFRHDSSDRHSLSANRIRSLIEDSSHVLWIGTYGGGLSALDLTRKRFAHHRNQPGNPNTLSHDIVWTFCEDAAGILWIGTDSGGLNRLDRATSTYRHYRHNPADPSSIASNTVRVVTPSRSGALWIGTSGAGLDRYDPATDRFAHFRHDPADPGSLAHDDLRAVYEDATGAVWVATYGGGLDRLDPVTGRFTHFRNDPADPASLASDLVRGIFEDSRGDLWIGTHGRGADRLNRSTGRFEHHRFDPTNPASLGGDFVFSFHEDRMGALWVATYGGGISRLDRATGTFTRFTSRDGLASDSAYGILEDGDGFLWISTNNGLSRLDPRTGEFRTFDPADGLQSNEFNGGSFYKSASGEMFFGGINGYNAFFPDQIALNTVPPPVVVTDLQLANRSVRVGELRGGRPTLTRPMESTDAVEISYRDQVITFEFAALHFKAPEKNRYAYRLEGFSDDWIPAAADRRFATFTGLRPGSYLFRVKAANADGVWNEGGASVRLTVTPPFWATWWFRVASLLVLAAVVAATLGRHVSHVRVVAELKTAHDAQMAIMPHSDPVVPGLDISGVCVAANEVGGDFFDYLHLGGADGPPCIAVGDVAGKAMSAAMRAVMASGMVAVQTEGNDSLANVMTTINRVLYRKAPKHLFTALCLVAIEPSTRAMTFVNAGLCPPLLKLGPQVTELEPSGPTLPLGSLADTRYQARTVAFEPGSVVVLFTDGVPEALDRHGAEYGFERLARFLAALDTATLPAREIAAAIVHDVARFAGGSRCRDDQAIVVVKAS
jgi:ligand-binding sensor domain-containing protein